MEELVERYQAPLTNFAYRLTLDYELACDVVQASFLEVIRWGRDHPDETVKRFRWLLYRIAHRQGVDAIRRARVRRARSLDETAAADEEPCVQLSARLASEQPGPEAMVLAEEEADLLRRKVAALPTESRDALTLRFFEGLSFAEIGEVLECREGAARQRVHYAVGLLRRQLGLASDGSPAEQGGPAATAVLIWALLYLSNQL